MALHGFEVKPGKPTPYVPPPELSRLYLKQAALPPDSPKDARSSLMIKSGDMEKPLCLGTLSRKGPEHMLLELVLDEYTELSIKGNCPIHVLGVKASDDDSDEGLDPSDLATLKGFGFGQEDDEDDEDDDDYHESDDSDVPRLEELPVDPKAKLPNGKKKLPVVEEPSSSSDDDDDDDDDDHMDDDNDDDDSDVDPPSLPQVSPPKLQEKKKSKGKQLQATAPTSTPPPQQKGAGKQQKGAKREAAQMDNPTPKRAKEGDGKKQKGGPAATPPPAAGTSPASTATTAAPTPSPSPLPAKRKDTRRFKNGFIIHNTKYGNPDGKVSRKGKTMVVSYVGKLENGQVFDKTKGKKTFEFVLGVGQVIKGWDKGLEDMRVGDKRKLTVPPTMGYGSVGSPPVIPPNATLIFDITLEDVK